MADKEIKGSFEEKIETFHLPRSSELPELDFYMDQVISIMEKNLSILSTDKEAKFITPAMINNYVKLGIIPPPKKKRYSKEHICYLFIICTLKSAIPISSVTDIIKSHLKNRTVYELYDLFCEAYENLLARAYEAAREISAEAEEAEEGVAKIALFMAISASTSQLIATSTLKSVAIEEIKEENAQ